VLAGLLALSILAWCQGHPVASRVDAKVPVEWTRLHEALAKRTRADGTVVGLDEVELLLWPGSTYLLEEARLKELRAALAAFRGAGPRGPEVDGLRRVLMQQELWAAFDWSFERIRATEGAQSVALNDLARELAAVLALSAPTAAELEALPDNLSAAEAAALVPAYADEVDPQIPFLPRGLSSFDGGWVYVRDGSTIGPLALTHSLVHNGRAAFGVAVRLPEGRNSTLVWLETLPSTGVSCTGSTCGLILEEHGRAHTHLPALPAVPPGTQVALVQRALAFDDHGTLRLTPLVQRIQVRAFMDLPKSAASLKPFEQPEGWPWQAVTEHDLKPSRLLAGEAGGLVALHRGEQAHSFLGSHGDDVELELYAEAGSSRFGRLDSCVGCHGAIGLASVNSYTGIFTGPGGQYQGPLRVLPRALVPASEAVVAGNAVEFKRALSDWGALWAWGFGEPRR
jgi:hypothetical protein